MKDVLVIIDMQYWIPPSDKEPSFKRVIKAILREIEYAKRRRYVVVVETGCNPTYPKIMKALRGRKFSKIKKILYDGSSEIGCELKKKDKTFNNIYVMGCATDCCVRETVKGLRERFGKERVEVIPDACYPTTWKRDYDE